ncbi:MAG TPA: methyltransferase domain-containing protein [Bdellovibrionota bacterium]|jgi:SAM-dependent methyltransferase
MTRKPLILSLALCAFAEGFAISTAHAEGGGGERSVDPQAESRKSRATKLMNLTGDSEFADDRGAWDKTYNRKDYVYGKEPSAFLVKHVSKLPKGRALDIAMGEGRHAVYLAKKGFQVEGVDISSVGLRKAQKLAAENGVKLKTINADLNKFKIQPNSYMVIMNFYYLQRNLFPQIIAGLKKGGVLVFETNTMEQLQNPGGKDMEKEYLLEPGELKEAFSELEIVHYSETNDGKNAVASLIARKR